MKARAIWLAIPLMAGVAFAQSGGAAGSTGSTAEMKTMTYRGVLVDLACGAATASAGAPSGATGSANRSAGDCAVTAGSTQFGLKMDNGQMVRFDLVGNQRAQDALKTNKGWNKNLAANKPLTVKVSGVMQGEKLIVSSVH